MRGDTRVRPILPQKEPISHKGKAEDRLAKRGGGEKRRGKDGHSAVIHIRSLEEDSKTSNVVAPRPEPRWEAIWG